MKTSNAVRERFLQDQLPVRLGNLAANLARIASFSDQADHKHVVQSLVRESQQFAEWVSFEARPDLREVLIELQLQLEVWQNTLLKEFGHPARRKELADLARDWSDRILKASGLLGA